jgi:hypothetical protein
VIDFGDYKNVDSVIKIRCNACSSPNDTWETKVRSYLNAKKTGCPGCKKRVASETHKGKVTSEDTKRKIGEKVSQRPGSLTGVTGAAHPRSKGGTARDLKNPSNADYEWKNAVRKRCGYACVITQERVKKTVKNGKPQRFACHHLESFDVNPDLRYEPTNGVFLKWEIHSAFHDEYGYGRNTEAQFVKFCREVYGIDWSQRKKDLGLE